MVRYALILGAMAAAAAGGQQNHVWAIMGFPNIAKLSAPNARLYLTTTHFHPEHAAGDAGFPADTFLIRNAVQQREMDAHGKELLATFSGRNAQWKELLADASVRLLWFGGAHTKGDELIFFEPDVEPDRTLISGDVVQNKTVLDKIAALSALHVLPDHSSRRSIPTGQP